MQGSCQTSRAKDSYAQFMKMTTIDEHKNNLLLFSFTLLFFLGGFTPLVYQVAWQRLLTQVIGIDSYSVTLIVPFLWSAWGLADCWGLGSSIGARTPLLMVHIFRNNYSTGRATSVAYSANVVGAGRGLYLPGSYWWPRWVSVRLASWFLLWMC